MKIRLILLMALLTASLCVRSADAARVSFSAGLEIHAAADFYTPLTPYGSWVDVASYGRCWHPNGIEADWRPYSNGSWESTDVGWYWVSDEPFAWACYHYGSWVDDARYGWVWVPGVEWAPAWVVWRESDTHIGWAPCGPHGTVAAPSLFVFVEAGHFCDPIRPRNVIVNNTTIINRTTVVNNFRSQSRTINGTQRTMMVNPGPSQTKIQRATGRNLQQTPITQAVEKTPKPSNMRQPEQRGVNRDTRPNPTPTPTPAERTPAVKEPAGATRENPAEPAKQAPREERRSTVTPEAPQKTAPPSNTLREHAPAAPQQHEPAHPPTHVAPQSTHVVPQAPHGPPAQQGRGQEKAREQGRGHDVP